ncbi:MAG: precorrin-4 C(11)-methyltransferase [Candidatus Omnitrophota bacterium]
MTKVYFIGAGPGDPELLTLKAAKIIKLADIVIYAGSLINKTILESAKNGAKLYDSSRMNLEEILGIIRKEKSTDKTIARVHSGEPSIYGAIQEQMDFCDKEGIEYNVIPGVSSFCAAAAGLKQELTLPNISQTVILTRAAGRTEVPKKEDLARLAKIKATLVIFLSVDKIGEVIKKLLSGYGRNTPVAVVYRASWPDEKIVSGTLSDIAVKVKKSGIKKQALIFVGEVLAKAGFKKSCLYNKTFSHGFRVAN